MTADRTMGRLVLAIPSAADPTMAFASTYRDGVESGIFRFVPGRLAGRMMEQMIMTGGKAVMDADEPAQDVGEIAQYTAELVVSAFRIGQE